MHDLILNDNIIKSHEFGDNNPPILSKNKGVWLPRVIIEPVYDHEKQTIELVKKITTTESRYEYIVSDIPIETLISKKKKELANIRYDKEIAGISINGTTIKTDRESQSLITGAYSASLINPEIVIDWKGENGWIKINAEQIKTIAGAVIDYVQACFTKEKELAELIENDLDTDITQGWP